MYKRRARQQKQLQDTENQENQPEDPQDQKQPFYLIVEASASSSPGRSQYWLISSKDIVDVPVVNNETVYTGKQLQFRLKDQRLSSGTCVLFSPDFSFVQSQFRQITSTMEADKGKASPMVLNNSTRGNILTQSNGNSNSGKSKLKMLPNVITVKTIKREAGTDSHPMEIPELGDPDAENRPPGQNQNPVIMQIGGGCGTAKVMTFDQQSQTDTKMWDSVVPATASQMHQQSSQMAQLIRANNGLVQEVKQMKETTTEIKQIVGELNSKLNQALAMLIAQPVAKCEPPPSSVDAPMMQYSANDTSCNDSMASASEIVHYEVVDAMDQYHQSAPSNSSSTTVTLTSAPPSREASVARSTKSENTPPLKKNKAKLNNSMKMNGCGGGAVVIPPLTSDDQMLSIGENNTLIPASVFSSLKYDNFSTVTRKILAAVFDRETLASHSLTGKPSPAFLERGAKMQLDAAKISDIIKYVMESCGVTEVAVRGVITSKCADENKMLRLHAKKRASIAAGEEQMPSKRRQTMHN